MCSAGDPENAAGSHDIQKVYKIIERKSPKGLAILLERCYNIQA